MLMVAECVLNKLTTFLLSFCAGSVCHVFIIPPFVGKLTCFPTLNVSFV